MKLTKEEVQKIADNYHLGLVNSVKYIDSGWSNYSFEVKTTNGDYILQLIGSEFNKDKKATMKRQFRLLNFLYKQNFPYEIPNPLESKEKKYFMTINGKHLWCYKKIIGKTSQKMNIKQFKNLAIALSTYHKYVKKLRIGKKSDFNYKWLENKYKKFAKIRPKNKEDRLMLKSLDLFKNALRILKKLNYGDNFLLCHADISGDNAIFDKDNVIGIIDFNNVEFAPLANDIAITIFETLVEKGKYNKRKFNIFLKEYEKINKLSKKDKSLIVPLVIRYYCVLFWWHYEEMKKYRHIRFKELDDDAESVKRLSKELGWI